MFPRLHDRVSCLRDSSDAGFTLIEVVVSVVLFVIVAASATVAVANGIKTSNSTRDRVTATNLAQQQIELVRGSILPTAGSTAPVVGGETFSVNVNVTTPTPPAAASPSCYPGGTRQVTVVVSWPGSAGRSVRMDTVLAC